jgi:hypothetical protein
MKTRFLADADFTHDIVNGVLRREPAVDFRAALHELRALSDRQVLDLAASEGRILVSHDRKTMPRAFGEFIQVATSPGLFIISQKTNHLDAIEDLLLVWEASEAEEWVNRICTLPL